MGSLDTFAGLKPSSSTNAGTAKIKGVIDALDQGNFWRKELNWVICMQTRGSTPFKEASVVKDWVDLYPEDVGNKPIGDCTSLSTYLI